MSFYEIVTTYILPLFIPSEVLNQSLGLSFWTVTIGDLFAIIFGVICFFVISWFLIILPWKICRKLMRIDKGGSKH